MEWQPLISFSYFQIKIKIKIKIPVSSPSSTISIAIALYLTIQFLCEIFVALEINKFAQNKFQNIFQNIIYFSSMRLGTKKALHAIFCFTKSIPELGLLLETLYLG